jgi:transposase
VDEERLRRHDLSDAEWARLEPLLPRHPRQGHRWNDHRLVINGIFFRTRTGCPWRDLPERFGNWKTVYNRHRRWSADGTWEMILDRLRAGCDEAAGRAWTVAVDATVVRTHQHAAGARREPPADIDPAVPADVVAGLPVREFRWYKGPQHSKSPGRAGRISIVVPSVSRAYAPSPAGVLMPPPPWFRTLSADGGHAPAKAARDPATHPRPRC